MVREHVSELSSSLDQQWIGWVVSLTLCYNDASDNPSDEVMGSIVRSLAESFWVLELVMSCRVQQAKEVKGSEAIDNQVKLRRQPQLGQL